MTEKKSDKEIKVQNIHYWIDSGIDLDQRIIMLDEDVDAFTIGPRYRALQAMINDDPNSPITIIINSFGGCVYSGLAFYDLITKYKDTPIICEGTGSIMSAGAMIFLASDYRIASENSTFMIHSVSSGTIGKIKEMEIDLEEAKRLNNVMINILDQKTKKKYTKKWWENEIEHKDKYYNVKQAKEMGIITKKYEG